MAKYLVADIHAQLGAFAEAVHTYEEVEKMTSGKQVGVTASLANTQLSLGRQTASGGFKARSRRAFHSALDLSLEVLKSGVGHRPWAWKVIGDAAFELSTQEADLDDAEDSARSIRLILEYLVSDDVDKRSTVESVGHAANLLQSPLDLYHTIKAAVFAYAYRAHLLKNEPRVADPALYDLACALHALALKSEDKEVRKGCMKGAVSAIRLALERDAGDERLWNALAVICAEGGEQVAQHAFVVSLELYAKVRMGFPVPRSLR